MQTCPLCDKHSLEYCDGKKECLTNECPCSFKVDANEVAQLRLLESIHAEALMIMSHSDLGKTLRNIARRRLVAVLEGDPSWPDYWEYEKQAKLENAFVASGSRE